jgi:hypothetical protein
MIVHIKKLIANKHHNCSLKIDGLFLFCYFVVYGFYGAVLPRLDGDYYSLKIATITLILLIPPLILILKFNSESSSNFCFKLEVSTYQIIFVAIASCIGIYLGYERLNVSLYSDELAYASSANGHGLVIINFLSKYYSSNMINISSALRIINVFIL